MICRRQWLLGAASLGGTSLGLPSLPARAAQGIDFSRFSDYRAGAQIILPNRIFDEDIEIEVNGTAAQPVVVKAVVPYRSVFRGRVSLKGRYGVLTGFTFERTGALRVEGDGHKVQHCRFVDGVADRAIMLANGIEQRVEHCLVQRWDRPGIAITGGSRRAAIVSCLFDNRGLGPTSGAAVQIGLGDKDAYRNLEARVEACRFVGWSAIAGKDKVLTIKSSDNLVKHCTFEACDARVQVRFGSFNRFEGCYLFGTRCLRVLDEGNRILGCLIRESASERSDEQGIVVAAGNHAAGSGDVHLPGTTKDGHPQALNTVLAGCDVDHTNIGAYYNGHDRPAVGTIVRNHRSLSPIRLIEGHNRQTDMKPNAAYEGSFEGWRYLTDGEVGPQL